MLMRVSIGIHGEDIDAAIEVSIVTHFLPTYTRPLVYRDLS